MRIVFITSLLSVLIVACSDKDKLPKDILPEKQMRELMWDMIRTGEFLNGFIANKDSAISKKPEIEKWFSKVYQLHKINKEVFDKNFAYYKDHPGLMKTILDSLAKRQVYTRQFGPDSSAIKYPAIPTPAIKTGNPVQSGDSLRRTIDTLRKKMIKRRKAIPKPV